MDGSKSTEFSSESESHLRQTQKIAKIVKWELDLKSGHLFWSDEVYRIFKIPQKTSFTSENFIQLALPEDGEYVEQHGQTAEDLAPSGGETQPSFFRKLFASFTSFYFLLLAIILILGVPLSTWAEKTPNIDLTPEEQAWLDTRPTIKARVSNFPPFHFMDQGKPTGFSIELMDHIANQTGLDIQYVSGIPWSEGLGHIKHQDGKVDLLLTAMNTPERNEFMLFSKNYLEQPFIIYTRKDNQTISNIKDLIGKTVAIEAGYALVEMIRNAYPGIRLMEVKGFAPEALRAVSSGDADAYIGNMAVANYHIDNLGLIHLKSVGTAPFGFHTHGFGVRKDWPELASILNKALHAISPEKRHSIMEKWGGSGAEQMASASFRNRLNEEEKAWIDQKLTVRVRIVDYPPYIIVNSNEAPQGIVIEYLKLIGERSGVTFKYEVTDQPFAEFLESMKQFQGPDITPVIMPTPEREQYLSFSEIYISSPYVIFIREQDKPILDINGLAEKTVAVPRGFVVHDKLARDYPEIRLALFDSDEKALQAVAIGQADAYIGNLTVAIHIVHRRGFSSLQVTAAGPFKEQSLSMGNRKDWPELTSIINKVLASITEEEKTDILNKYIAIRYEQGIDKTEVLKWILVFGAAASGIVLVFMFWNKQLSRKVTERTSQLMETESRFRATFEQAAVGVAHVSLEGRFLRVNKKFCEIVGYSEEEIRALTFQDITHPDDLDADLDYVKQVLKGARENFSTDKRYFRKDASIVWINLTVSLLFDRKGKPQYFVSVVKDISERKQAEDSLQQSYDFQEHLNTSMPDAVFSVKMPERVIEWANDSFNVLGYEAKECVGESTEKFYASPEEYQKVGALLEDVIRDGRDVLLTEAMLRRKNDEVFPAEVNVSVYRENGKVASLTALVRDISERKHAEAELEKSYKEIEKLQKQLQAESTYLQEEIRLEHNFDNIIGNSDAIQYTLFKVKQVAETDSTVLILGETGTGKELIARAIHHNSQRKDRPLIKINCAALPANLIETELFGHEKGSFTGAVAKHMGRFEVADGSTLFLDEIGELPLELQSKLLRVLEDGEFERLGSTKTIKVDVRIIAATNRDLEKDAREGRFRQDLWYRLNVFPITLPPLRVRIEDIPLIVQFYVDLFARKQGKRIDSIPVKVMKTLQSHTWPGNVRELQNIIERAVISTSGAKLQLTEGLSQRDQGQPEGFKSLQDIERDYIVSVLEKTGWKVSGMNSAAEILGLPRSTLRARMMKLEIHK